MKIKDFKLTSAKMVNANYSGSVVSGCVQGQQMGFGIEQVSGWRIPLQYILLTEEQVEVFQRFCQEEAFHHISWASLLRVQHTPDSCVPTTRHLAVFLKPLEDTPSQIPVSLIACKVVHVPEAFQGLWTKKVVCIIALYQDITSPLWFQVEVGNLR